ncbi:MAG: hypothetical protein CL886_08655 [Dehalococcoidia bacterium]|nr:hypothetical protein [Dehalococcoidia bacterium]
MIKLLTAFWNIMIKKSGQETLPDSNFFLGLIFVFFFATQVFSGIKVSGSVELFARSFLVDALLLICWVKVLVELYGTQILFRRSLIALFGTGGILNIFYSPLILQFSKYLGEGELLIESQFPVWFTLATLLVALWSIIIMAHIFSRLISNPSYSVLITLLYLMVNFILQTSIAAI